MKDEWHGNWRHVLGSVVERQGIAWRWITEVIADTVSPSREREEVSHKPIAML
jgi:hypothetical protein